MKSFVFTVNIQCVKKLGHYNILNSTSAVLLTSFLIIQKLPCLFQYYIKQCDKVRSLQANKYILQMLLPYLTFNYPSPHTARERKTLVCSVTSPSSHTHRTAGRKRANQMWMNKEKKRSRGDHSGNSTAVRT